MVKFNGLKLYKEYPKFLADRHDLRVYTTTEKYSDDTMWFRWHFGFSKQAVRPIVDLLSTTLYWGESPWTEHEDFVLWWLPITTKTDEFPKVALNRQLRFYIDQYNLCINFVKRAAAKMEKEEIQE